jgi:hypothetical protein
MKTIAMKTITKAKTSLTAGVMILGLASLVACSSTPPPNSDIAVAKTALTSAVAAGGAEFAPVELKTAQDKLDRAEKMVADKDNDKYPEARRLAVEAGVDAKAAETKALAAKSEKSLQETQDGQRALQEEMQRQ